MVHLSLSQLCRHVSDTMRNTEVSPCKSEVWSPALKTTKIDSPSPQLPFCCKRLQPSTTYVRSHNSSSISYHIWTEGDCGGGVARGNDSETTAFIADILVTWADGIDFRSFLVVVDAFLAERCRLLGSRESTRRVRHGHHHNADRYSYRTSFFYWIDSIRPNIIMLKQLNRVNDFRHAIYDGCPNTISKNGNDLPDNWLAAVKCNRAY